MISTKTSPLRFPVLEHGAESLVQGYLMRRNILTYQAPRKNEGYDLICIHPDPRKPVKPVRVQVKSRYQTDCDRSIIVPRKTSGAFDYVVAVFLNVGCFFPERPKRQNSKCEPEFFTLPASWVEQNRSRGSFWGKVSLRGKNTDRFKNEGGFEQIAKDLGVVPPARPRIPRQLKRND
jgi:hypothetical protein